MRSPKVGAIIGAIGVVFIGSTMLVHGPQGHSPMAGALQWVFLAVAAIALVGSLIQIANGR